MIDIGASSAELKMPALDPAARTLLANYEAVLHAQRNAMRWLEWLLEAVDSQLHEQTQSERLTLQFTGGIQRQNPRTSADNDTERRPLWLEFTVKEPSRANDAVATIYVQDVRFKRWPDWSGARIRIKVSILRGFAKRANLDQGELERRIKERIPRAHVTKHGWGKKSDETGLVVWKEFIDLGLDSGDPLLIANRIAAILAGDLTQLVS